MKLAFELGSLSSEEKGLVEQQAKFYLRQQLQTRVNDLQQSIQEYYNTADEIFDDSSDAQKRALFGSLTTGA